MASSDNSWVFDSLICYLNGPMWNVPIQSFIEEKSLVFEPNNINEIKYKEIHEEFKNLVDLLLGSYMEDMCITPEQFEMACSHILQEKISSFLEQNLFEQIWAANDYELFVQMMIEKNTELQLQALHLYDKKYKTPSATETEYISEAPKTKHVPKSEKQVMVEVIRSYESEDTKATEKIKKHVSFEETNNADITASTRDNNNDTEETKFENASKHITEVDDEDIKKRQEYLKAQRDKLVALKKQVRKKHLQVEISNMETTKNRPQSARAAEAVLAGEISVEPGVLKMRKSLAERLRSEVISKKSN